MFKTLMTLILVTVLAGTGFGLVGMTVGNAERADCPGKIVCPLTGELVCKDRCPAAGEARADCPGKVECPMTGEMVCKDHCPVTNGEAAPETVRPCCLK